LPVAQFMLSIISHMISHTKQLLLIITYYK
jgi:hypothetical protein